MDGLRVYMDVEAVDIRNAGLIFYSRRAGGPYYRWRYETSRGQWLGSRMHALELAATELIVAPWKGVPTSLKSSLHEHYLD